MTPIMYHIAVHLMTGHFLVIHGNVNNPETWEIISGHCTMEDAEKEVRELESEEGGEDE